MVTNVKLHLITKRAKSDKSYRFSNLMHLVNLFSLSSCYYMLKRNKVPGIDNITLEEYGRKFNENVGGLLERMKKMSYRPQAVRRTYIPKEDGKRRELGIPVVEDKLVQMMFLRILEAIFEPDFKDISYGFRRGRDCHQALCRLNNELWGRPVNFVIDADIKGFFDNVDHQVMKRCLEQRISDRKFIRYIMRFLKSGIMEEGKFYETERGTPQGGVISPILANIYLHYSSDKWIEEKVKTSCRGYVFLVRYADDFVIGTERADEKDKILSVLEKRLKRFSLELSSGKTRVVRFGRHWKRGDSDKSKRPETFNFVGFTHYCGKSKRGGFKVGRRTAKRRYNRSLKRINVWLSQNRNKEKLWMLWKKISQKMIGHYRFYGVSGNYLAIKRFRKKVIRLVYYWVNRRSQKRSFSWRTFNAYLKRYPLPEPHIYHNLNVFALRSEQQ